MKAHIRNISASTLQLIINQIFGLVIFYVLSAEFDKNVFGNISWALAVLLTAFNILSFGIDQLIIKKIASGNDPSSMLSLYTMHVIIAGPLFYGVLAAVHFLIPGSAAQQDLILIIGIGKLMIFFSSPFKQVATGMQNFPALLFMSVASNIIRGSLLIFYSLTESITLNKVLIIFIVGDVVEFIISWIICRYVMGVPFYFSGIGKGYRVLVKESLSQTGVVIFSALLARLDWILIGSITSSVKLAEYSFAYKVFEVSTLPLLVIAPLLLPAFSRMFATSRLSMRLFHSIFRVEMAIATLVGMCLFILWVPVIDHITNGKYGEVNLYTILILGISMPFLYMSNFLWTILFADGRMKRIFWIFLITFLVNLAADLILIPLYNNEGAATGFLLAMMVQCSLYLIAEKRILHDSLWSVLLCPFCAVISVIMANVFFTSPILICISAVVFYLSMLILVKQLRIVDIGLFSGIEQLNPAKATEGTPSRID